MNKPQKLNKGSKNPYRTGNPVGDSPAFVGRDDIVREVVRVLEHPNDNTILLYGQRRIGKTSLLQELQAQLPEKGYHPIFFDLLDKAQEPLGELLRGLARKISKVLPEKIDANLGKEPESTFRNIWLPNVLKKLPLEKRLVLLFDEFDVLADPNKEQASAAFFPYLRKLLNINTQRLSFVFVIGRKVDDLANIALSLFKGTPHKRVSLLNQSDTIKLICLSEINQITLHWENEAIEKIWQLTNGHPYLTQLFCSRVWDNIAEQKSEKLPTATLFDVEKALPETLEASCNALEWLWNGLPPAERVVASLLAGAGAKAISEKQLEQLLHDNGVRMMLQELQEAPRILQEWDLIEPAEGGYRFRVELLRTWIAKNKSLRQVQGELDHVVDPIADDFYNAGKKLYQQRQLKKACGPLRQTIDSNRYHVGANLLLAEVLLALKKADEACEILDKLYTSNPKAARSGLIKTLLALAVSSKKEDEQLKYYERVLELDVVHPDAKVQTKKIWERRGDKAYKKGQLKEALKIYKANDLNEKAAKVEQEIHRSATEIKRTKSANRREKIMVIKERGQKYGKVALELVGVMAIFVVTYLFFDSIAPKGVLFEIKPASQTGGGAYVLTYVASDKQYVPEKVEILPTFNSPMSQVKFQYDDDSPIELVKNPETHSYQVSKERLLKTKGENFELLDQDRFTFSFNFQFDKSIAKKAGKLFTCQITATNHLDVPCEIKETGYLSLFRGIPWFWVAPALAFIWVFLLEMIVVLKNPELKDDEY